MATLDEIEAQHYEAEKRVVKCEADLRMLDLALRAARQEEYEIIYAHCSVDPAVTRHNRKLTYNEINAMVWTRIREGDGDCKVAVAWLEWHAAKTALGMAAAEQAHLKNLYFDKKEATRQRP